ncbi:MAG: hypothetical protein KDB53_05475, partial [Planctomycetes bacterium]|nr:hypothetical protein [Planctomycetota bacterium]
SPAGDPTHRPPPRAFRRGWRLGTPDLILDMPEPFTIPAEGQIPYHHVLIDPGFTEDRWVNGIEIRPGNREVVHHIMLFLVNMKTLDPEAWFADFDGGKKGYFALMVPGETPTRFDDGLAKLIPAGHQIVMTIHYQSVGLVAQDQSRIGLHFAKGAPRHRVLTEAACQDDALVLPPNAPRTRIFSNYFLQRDAVFLSFTPHMHYRGVSFRYTMHYPSSVVLERAVDLGGLRADVGPRFHFDPDTKTLHFVGGMTVEIEDMVRPRMSCLADIEALRRLRANSRSEILLDVPRYDFGWQNTYRLAKPLPVPAGALLSCYADFDNSVGNPLLTAAMASQEVRWGLQSTDEMMIGYFDIYFLDGGGR